VINYNPNDTKENIINNDNVANNSSGGIQNMSIIQNGENNQNRFKVKPITIDDHEYQGEMKGNKKDGHGELKFPDGSIYIG